MTNTLPLLLSMCEMMNYKEPLQTLGITPAPRKKTRRTKKQKHKRKMIKQSRRANR